MSSVGLCQSRLATINAGVEAGASTPMLKVRGLPSEEECWDIGLSLGRSEKCVLTEKSFYFPFGWVLL